MAETGSRPTHKVPATTATVAIRMQQPRRGRRTPHQGLGYGRAICLCSRPWNAESNGTLLAAGERMPGQPPCKAHSLQRANGRHYGNTRE
jgi:hypothetical protein